MTYLAVGLVVVWVSGLLYLGGVHLNDVRLAYNNFVPGEQPAVVPLQLRHLLSAAAILLVPIPIFVDLALAMVWLLSGRRIGPEHFSIHFARLDRSLLTEAGRAYLDKAIRHERFLLGWPIAGIAPVVCVSYLLSI